MVKREIRTRPVDVFRKLQVVRALDEAQECLSDELLERSSSMASTASSTAPPSIERQTSTVTVKAKEIPTPIVAEVAGYEADVEPNFKQPQLYIRAKKTGMLQQQAGETEPMEYNLEVEDEDWLRKHRLFGTKGELEGVLSEDLMEKIIDELEKAQGGAMELMSSLTAEAALAQSRLNLQAVGSNRQMVQEVYGYWVSKRQRFKKPLLRKFWPVTSINDTNPHLVFRPREKERYKLRKHRNRNDMESYRKMQTLRRDLDKALHLLDMIKRRERLKLNAILLHEEKFLQLAAEQGGQTRKPVIPRETPEIKFKIRLRVTGPSQSDYSAPNASYHGPGGAAYYNSRAPSSRRERLRRDRQEAEDAGRVAAQQQLDANPEQERLKKPMGMGYKEKEGALPTPDYLPSFMEDWSLRGDPVKEEERRLRPYSSDWAAYTWRWASTPGKGGKGPATGGAKKRPRRIGHHRSGVVTTPFRAVPSEFSTMDDETEPYTVKYRCRGRIGRGGRLILDRLPLAPVHKDPRHVAELDNRGLGHHRGSRGGPRRHVWLSSGSELRSALTKYPTTPLEHSHDVFKYPTRFPEISDPGGEDGEDEVLEPLQLMMAPSTIRPSLAPPSSVNQGAAPMELEDNNPSDDLLAHAQGSGSSLVEEEEDEEWEGGEDPMMTWLDHPFGLHPLTTLPPRPLPHPSEAVALFKFQLRV